MARLLFESAGKACALHGSIFIGVGAPDKPALRLQSMTSARVTVLGKSAVKERTGLFYPGAPLELTIRLADPVVRCLLLRPYAYKHLARTNEAIGVLEASKLVLDFRPDRWAFCFRHTRQHLV